MAGAGIFDGRPTAGLIIHGAYNLPHLQHIVHVTADGNAGQAYLFGNLLAGKELDGFEIIAYEYAQPPVVLYHGRTVGHKSICRFETMLVKKLVIRFQEENPQITSVKCYYVQ